MAREIMSDHRDNTASPSTAPAPVSAVPPVAPTLPNVRDTLVGAFPEWDLVPTTHFVRRVK